jgi:hypothetical protein
MEKKVVERKNGRYQINEGIFDLIKIFLGAKSTSIKKIDDKKLSKTGKEIKNSLMQMDRIVKAKAAEAGKSEDEYIEDLEKQLGVKL